MTKPNSYILWEGLSPLDNKPLVLIATGFATTSANNKTGAMIQTWILRQDVHPVEAFKGSEGYSNCGDCIHRIDGSCYVNWVTAPTAVWRAYRRGSYGLIPSWDLFADRMLRIGSAGDPAMVPSYIWHAALEHAAGHTGYTHQWRAGFAQWAKGILQASCDSFADYTEAIAHGWMPYLVKTKNDPKPKGAIHCPSSEEMGRKTDCVTCGLCDGQSAGIVINGHGSTAGRIKPLAEVA